jgi:hypothetical protein
MNCAYDDADEHVAACKPGPSMRTGETGQFTSRDPLDCVPGTTTVTNPDHYADNDPLNRTDPTGLRARDGSFSDAGAQQTPG